IRVLQNRPLTREILPVLDSLEEVETMLAERIGEWTEQWKNEGMLAGLQKGRMEGRQEEKKEVARKLLLKKLPVDDIADATGLSLGEVKLLSAELSQ
ncbi:MAG: hypothetical protein LBQ51_05775, partial [Desulfovibrio sp.]|nr:hypothetical protein [Desulfovibrio sp.]